MSFIYHLSIQRSQSASQKIPENKIVNDTQVKKNAMIKCITFLNNNNDVASQVKVYVYKPLS